MSRRAFNLPVSDQTFLEQYGLPWETIIDGSQWLLIHDLVLDPLYSPRSASVALRIEVGYPQAALDMAYFYPAISRVDGTPIRATEVNQPLDGKQFQRWSRHRTRQNPWASGIDNIESHLILVEDWLDRELEK